MQNPPVRDQARHLRQASRRRARTVDKFGQSVPEKFESVMPGGLLCSCVTGVCSTEAGVLPGGGTNLMTRPIKSLWLLLLGVLGLTGGAASAATVGVLCSSELQGDSEYPAATGCIDVLAWSWGLSAPSSTGTGGAGGGGAGKASFQDLSLTKYADTSSDDFFRFAATQNTIKGIVEYREYSECGSGCTPSTPYLTIHLKDVKVSSQSMGGSPGQGRPTESIVLGYSQISYCYTESAKDSGQQCFAFDVRANTQIAPF